MSLPLTQEVIAACLHYLNLQTKVAQEKLEYLRRREAREINEINSKKEQLNNKNKTEKAIVRALYCLKRDLVMLIHTKFIRN